MIKNLLYFFKLDSTQKSLFETSKKKKKEKKGFPVWIKLESVINQSLVCHPAAASFLAICQSYRDLFLSLHYNFFFRFQTALILLLCDCRYNFTPVFMHFVWAGAAELCHKTCLCARRSGFYKQPFYLLLASNWAVKLTNQAFSLNFSSFVLKIKSFF